MKRKATTSLIEEISNGNRIDIKPNILIDLTLVKDEYIKMFQKNEWYKSLIEAEKTSYKSGKLLKYHYTFADGRQMVEEYNTDTDCLVRRAWKVKSRLGSEEWDVEIGDPIVLSLGPRECDLDGLKEGNNEPKLQRRNTRINLEWRIRNLPYPLETYDITINKIDRCIVIRTSNKKYFKKLIIPELDRLNIPLDQGNLHISHAFNTLVILYNKPKDVMDMERKWLEELKKVKPTADQVPADCKPF